jgi:tetratricopeptide (TPR) repeat protein
MLMKWGWPIAAREQLTMAKEIAASKVTIYCFVGHTYRLERDYTNAIVWYKKALAFNPKHEFAYGGLAETCEALGANKNCIDNLEAAELLRTSNKAETTRNYTRIRRAFEVGGVAGY